MGTFRADANVPSRKKVKTQHVFNFANDLPWKSVSRPKESGVGADDGILELEEVEDVEVLYEETELGRTVKFNVSWGHFGAEVDVTTEVS
jgi:ATP-dependent RNA helicase DDX24/MAK5